MYHNAYLTWKTFNIVITSICQIFQNSCIVVFYTMAKISLSKVPGMLKDLPVTFEKWHTIDQYDFGPFWKREFNDKKHIGQFEHR